MSVSRSYTLGTGHVGRAKLKLKERVAIKEFLDTVVVGPSEGTYEYREEWDDWDVASHMSAELHREVTPNHVASVRLEFFPWRKGRKAVRTEVSDKQDAPDLSSLHSL